MQADSDFYLHKPIYTFQDNRFSLQMIRSVIATQPTSTGNYYFVSWSNDQMQPCWIDEKIYQEAITTPIETTSTITNKQKRGKRRKKGESIGREDIAIPALDKEKASSKLAIVQFFAWKKQKSSKELTQAQKKRKDGVKRYDSPLIQSLERICKDLEVKLKQPNQETYDDLIDYIQGYAYSKSNRMFLVANLLGKKKKACIPLKNMKRYFPQTLKDYLREIIELQKDSYRKKQTRNEEFLENIEEEIEDRRQEGNSFYFQDSSPNPDSRQNKQKKSKDNLEQPRPSSEDKNSPSNNIPSMSMNVPRHTNFFSNFLFSDPILQLGNKLNPKGINRSSILYRNDNEDSSDEEQDEQAE